MTTSAAADGAEGLGSFESVQEVSGISGGPGTSDVSEPRTRRWAKTDATQQRILDAATEVFGERGFSAATMGDIVARSGASIGSIYHHFGGKNELFLAIYERQSSDIDRRIEEVAQSVEGSPSFDRFARAYLEAVWANRRTSEVLSSGDVPPGYDRIRREITRTRFRKFLGPVDVDSTVQGRLLMRMLLAVMTESASMILTFDDDAEAQPVIDEAIRYFNLLLA